MNAPFQHRSKTPIVSLPRRSVPTIAGLIAFEATGRYLSFSRAAAELVLSQGAVSKRVRALEDTLGVALLVRNHRDVRLTETGESYLAEVQRILSEFAAVTDACIARANARKTLTIASSCAIALHWLLPRLDRFRSACPGISINLVTVRGQTSTHDGALGEVRMPLSPGAVPLWNEQFVPVAAPRLAATAVAEGLGALERLHDAQRPDLWARWDVENPSEVVQAIGSEHDGLDLVIEAALQGHGAALVPIALVGRALASGQLVALSECRLLTGLVMAFQPSIGRSSPALGAFSGWISFESAEDRKAQ